MGVAIANVGIPDIRVDEKGKLTGRYTLVSEKGIIMANNSFNEYQGLEVEWSKETMKLVQTLRANIENEISIALGIKGDETNG